MNKLFDFIQFSWNKGFFHLLGSNVFIQTVGFASQLFVAWILLPEDIGRIRIMQTYLGLAAILGGLGFTTSVLKLCSEIRPEGEKRFLYLKAFRYTLLSSGIVYIFIFAFSFMDMYSTDKMINQLFPLLGLSLIPMTANQLMTVYLQALKKIKMMANIQALTKIISIALIIITTYFWGLIGFIAASILGMIISTYWLHCKINIADQCVTIIPVEKHFSKHWFYAKFSFLANAIGQISLYLDLYLINYLIDDRELVGQYSFAVTLTIALQLITSTVQQMVTPYFSEKAGNLSDFIKTFRKYNVIFIVSTFFIAIACIFGVPWFIHFVFNGKYDASIIFFQILTIAWFIRNTYSLQGIAIWGLGKIQLNFYAVLIALPVNICGTYLLINYYHILGAAFGIVFSAVITLIIVTIQLQRIIKGLKDESNKIS